MVHLFFTPSSRNRHHSDPFWALVHARHLPPPHFSRSRSQPPSCRVAVALSSSVPCPTSRSRMEPPQRARPAVLAWGPPHPSEAPPRPSSTRVKTAGRSFFFLSSPVPSSLLCYRRWGPTTALCRRTVVLQPATTATQRPPSHVHHRPHPRLTRHAQARGRRRPWHKGPTISLPVSNPSPLFSGRWQVYPACQDAPTPACAPPRTLVPTQATSHWARRASPRVAPEPLTPGPHLSAARVLSPPVLITTVDQGSDDPRAPIPLRAAFLLKKPLFPKNKPAIPISST
jgi:hypothetical protein